MSSLGQNEGLPSSKMSTIKGRVVVGSRSRSCRYWLVMSVIGSRTHHNLHRDESFLSHSFDFEYYKSDDPCRNKAISKWATAAECWTLKNPLSRKKDTSQAQRLSSLCSSHKNLTPTIATTVWHLTGLRMTSYGNSKIFHIDENR